MYAHKQASVLVSTMLQQHAKEDNKKENRQAKIACSTCLCKTNQAAQETKHWQKH